MRRTCTPSTIDSTRCDIPRDLAQLHWAALVSPRSSTRKIRATASTTAVRGQMLHPRRHFGKCSGMAWLGKAHDDKAWPCGSRSGTSGTIVKTSTPAMTHPGRAPHHVHAQVYKAQLPELSVIRAELRQVTSSSNASRIPYWSEWRNLYTSLFRIRVFGPTTEARWSAEVLTRFLETFRIWMAYSTTNIFSRSGWVHPARQGK